MFTTKILDYHRVPLGIFSMAEGDGGGGGGQGESWRDELPDDLKANPSLIDVPDVATLAKNFVETKAMVGNSFRLPGEDAGEEDWTKFHTNLMEKVPSLMFKPKADDKDGMEKIYDQLGRPEKSDAYEIPTIEDKGVKLDMSLAEEFKGIAHKYGLNQKQFDGVVKGLTGVSVTKAAEIGALVDADVQKLITEWGSAYEKNLKLAIAGAERTKAPVKLVSLLKSGKPPSDLAKYFHGVATTLGDGEGNPLVHDSGTGEVMTPNEAKLMMSEMRRNKEHPLNVPSDPAHQSALDKYKTLSESAFPEARK